MSAAVWSMLVALSVLWGGSFLFIKLAVAAVPPLAIVLARVGLAALVLWAAVAATRQRTVWSREVVIACIGMAVLNNMLPFSLIAWGASSIGAGLGSVVNASTPVLTVLVAHGLTADERLTPRKAIGVLLGFAGVAVLMLPSLQGSGGEWRGILANLLACLSYAFAAVWGRRFRRLGVPPLIAAAGQASVATAVMLPLVLAVDRPWTLPLPSNEILLALLALGVFSTGLAYALYFQILARAGATNSALVTLLVPVSAVLLGVAVLGERLVPTQIAGMALIALGLLVLDGRLLRRRA
jgi:drug/metabolite transporter (DMT)-like permease